MKPTANLNDLRWMLGPWEGQLGDQRVAEDWRAPVTGTMSTMITLTRPESVDMIELISIRERDNSLVLHLRQFSPELELRHSDNLQLQSCDDESVRFASPGAAIEGLEYRRMTLQDQPLSGMQVEVTLAGGLAVTAALTRPATFKAA